MISLRSSDRLYMYCTIYIDKKHNKTILNEQLSQFALKLIKYILSARGQVLDVYYI